MEEVNELIQKFYTTRYDFLVTCCENLLKRYGKTDLKYELATESYFYVTNPKEKQKLLDRITEKTLSQEAKDEILGRYIVRFVTYQIRWSNTPFKKNWLNMDKNKGAIEYDNNVSEEDLYNLEDTESFLQEEDYLAYEKEISDKVNYVNHFIKNSTHDRQLLYDMVFHLGFDNGRKLAKHTGLSNTTCYNLIKGLKDDIKNGYFKANNQ